MSTVGFIGLGNMGAHMARNLMRAGHSLVVFDANPKTVQQFKVSEKFGVNITKRVTRNGKS